MSLAVGSWLVIIIISTTAKLSLTQQLNEWQQKILDAHNNYRRTVYPPGSNMNELTWATDLEQFAKKYAQKCLFEHSPGAERKGGENIASTGYTDAVRLSMLWFNERIWYNYNGSKGVCSAPSGKSCGHYVMVVRDEITKLGCAYAECGNSYYTFCEYDRGPKQEEPYTRGVPCSACPTYASYCKDGLCVPTTSECRISCKNCATRMPDGCGCACPSGVANDCSDASQVAPTCSKCNRNGTPCLNNGTDSSSDTRCSCSCTTNYVGPYCQVLKSDLDSSAVIQLRGTVSDSATIPISSSAFANRILPALRQDFITELKDFCLKSASVCKDVDMNQIQANQLKEIPGLTSSMNDGRVRSALIFPLGSGKYLPPDALLTVLQSAANKSQAFRNEGITVAGLQKGDVSVFSDDDQSSAGNGLPVIIIILIVLFALLCAALVAVVVILKIRPAGLTYVVSYVTEHGKAKSPNSPVQVTPKPT